MKIVLFQKTIKYEYTVYMWKTFLFQVIQFNQTILIQLIQFSTDFVNTLLNVKNSYILNESV